MNRSPTSPFRTTLGIDPAGTGVARREFVRWMDGAGVDRDVAGELAVVVSELAANAANASPPTEDPAEVAAWTEPDSVVIEVSNRVGRMSRRRPRWDLRDPLRSGGRGLMIVRAYTDDIAFQATDDTVVVRCRRLLSH